MFNEIKEKIEKTNEQRLKMALTLMNVMRHSEGVSMEIRSAVAASMLEMLETDMIDEDRPLIKVLNEGIDVVCDDAKKYGVNDLRSALKKATESARKIVEEKMDRINEGNSILNNINFNLN